MPTVIRFADGQSPIKFDEDYETIRDQTMQEQFQPLELHSDGNPVTIYPQNIVAVLPFQNREQVVVLDAAVV